MNPAPALLATGMILLGMAAIRVLTSAFFAPASPSIANVRDPLEFSLAVALPGTCGLFLCMAALARIL
jgi:hypothetical protein